MLNEDYKEILQILLRNKVKFLLIGAYAMGAHGYPRATGDIDVWVEPSERNSKKVYASLKEFGAPLKDIKESTFAEKGVVFQIGVAPRRIDFITKVSGLDFDEAYAHKQDVEIEGLKISLVSLNDLIKNKESTGRDKDKLDVKHLRKL